MRCIFATLGFEEKFAVRAITRHGLDRGDRVCIFRGPGVERAERAAKVLKDFVERYYGGEVELRFIEVPVESFQGAVAAVKGALEEYSRGASRVVVNLSGGMRVLVAAALTALSLAELDVEPLIELELEDSSSIVSIPLSMLKASSFKQELTEERRRLLKALVELREATIQELASKLGLSQATVRRHIHKLMELKLVYAKGPRPFKASPAEWATILV